MSRCAKYVSLFLLTIFFSVHINAQTDTEVFMNDIKGIGSQVVNLVENRLTELSSDAKQELIDLDTERERVFNYRSAKEYNVKLLKWIEANFGDAAVENFINDIQTFSTDDQ